ISRKRACQAPHPDCRRNKMYARPSTTRYPGRVLQSRRLELRPTAIHGKRVPSGWLRHRMQHDTETLREEMLQHQLYLSISRLGWHGRLDVESSIVRVNLTGAGYSVTAYAVRLLDQFAQIAVHRAKMCRVGPL